MTYNLLRDGTTILCNVSDIDIFEYIHKNHSYSVHHAVWYEGYQVTDYQTGKKIEVE